MPLVENGQIVQDRYHYVGNEEPIPERVPVIVPAQRFLANADALIRDGRAYSQARLLRETYAFRGTLRATGDVLRDQFHFLIRAGFDSFEVKKPADASAFVQAASRYSVVYQPTADGRVPALRRRVQANPSESADASDAAEG